ncbi:MULTISPECIES: AI-2E family transporter [Clostridium]|uniref:AI-2E family transporter n=1 Tax=Clostridium nitritogenes TaxID=83340 RepID=A0ABP3WTH8_9CLOT|nr:AI-2E family transporter [Clostridium baratii]AQM60733.1 AI-2E family transporter [Clostridium baratii]KJU71069.1 membrane protein [Clostridium baratii]MBS6042500.1 AI-2E family transporter [Clostridium baratii]MBT9832099.1 AI-2E family transporter [Clostridium baratii]MDY3207143.1 AI-2E family transporter [Clostridium baratii]
MKINWNTKYNTISVYAFIVVCAIIVFYLSISQMSTLMNKISHIIVILKPFIMGFAIAYLLDFVLRFYENVVFETKFFKKFNIKSKRGLGLLFTYVTAFLFIGLFIHFVLPQLIDSIVGLVNDIPLYIADTTKFINGLIDKLNLGEQYQGVINENFNNLIDYIIKVATNLLPMLGGFLTTLLSSIWNIVLGLIISIYLLIEKERFFALSKKITYAILPKRAAVKTIELTHRSNDTFGKFLSGKILDSFIIGILTFIVLTIFSMPYTLLISVIVGITNIIPFFGPFIGAIPSVIIILFVSPIKAFWFLVIILIIQQIDGNIIGPKILGDSIGISAFWILFSILVAGKFLGLVGMVIGVPLFAIVYSIIKEIIEDKLDKKGLKTETEDYM